MTPWAGQISSLPWFPSGWAEALVRAGGTISVQVLNKVARVMRRKLGAP